MEDYRQVFPDKLILAANAHGSLKSNEPLFENILSLARCNRYTIDLDQLTEYMKSIQFAMAAPIGFCKYVDIEKNSILEWSDIINGGFENASSFFNPAMNLDFSPKRRAIEDRGQESGEESGEESDEESDEETDIQIDRWYITGFNEARMGLRNWYTDYINDHRMHGIGWRDIPLEENEIRALTEEGLSQERNYWVKYTLDPETNPMDKIYNFFKNVGEVTKQIDGLYLINATTELKAELHFELSRDQLLMPFLDEYVNYILEYNAKIPDPTKELITKLITEFKGFVANRERIHLSFIIFLMFLLQFEFQLFDFSCNTYDKTISYTTSRASREIEPSTKKLTLQRSPSFGGKKSKNRKSKNRKSKNRKSKNRKSKNRKSKNRKSKKSK